MAAKKPEGPLRSPQDSCIDKGEVVLAARCALGCCSATLVRVTHWRATPSLSVQQIQSLDHLLAARTGLQHRRDHGGSCRCRRGSIPHRRAGTLRHPSRVSLRGMPPETRRAAGLFSWACASLASLLDSGCHSNAIVTGQYVGHIDPVPQDLAEIAGYGVGQVARAAASKSAIVRAT